MATDYLIRPMKVDDAHAVESITADAFREVDVRTARASDPEPERRSEQRVAHWHQLIGHWLEHDAAGCWVAEDTSGLLGMSTATRRDMTWILGAFAVRPGNQGRGIGKQLLEAASTHGANCLRAMICSSPDPMAVRRYRLAGFVLHPTMLMNGRVPRSQLPVVERVREGSVGDIDLCNSVDRHVRESAHGVDHEFLSSHYRMVVSERTTGSGYAYIRESGGAALVAAANRRTATALLWESLAATSPEDLASIDDLTSAQEWAIDIGMELRMELRADGYLALRGMAPPAPYIPNGHFL